SFGNRQSPIGNPNPWRLLAALAVNSAIGNRQSAMNNPRSGGGSGPGGSGGGGAVWFIPVAFGDESLESGSERANKDVDPHARSLLLFPGASAVPAAAIQHLRHRSPLLRRCQERGDHPQGRPEVLPARGADAAGGDPTARGALPRRLLADRPGH